MKRGISLLMLAAVAATFTFAQEGTTEAKKEAAPAKAEAKTVTMKGYVVDQMCAKGFLKKENFMQKAAAHPQECALDEACAASGYGIFSDGKWFTFDDAGSKQAKTLIEKSKREKELMFEVSGKVDGGTIAVASIKETSMEKKNEEKSEGKKESREHKY